jgi:hypothetical protein
MIKVTIYYYSEYYRKLKLLLGQIINARSGHIKVMIKVTVNLPLDPETFVTDVCSGLFAS